MQRLPWQNQTGFSLIELIIVIVILGVLATGTATFLRWGADTFAETSDRENLLSSSRFVVERLNREVRNALPNSPRVVSSATRHCLEFVPASMGITYKSIPASDDASAASSSMLTLVPFVSAMVPTDANKVSIYAVNSQDIYDENSSIIAEYTDFTPKYSRNDLASAAEVTLTLDQPTIFAANSPTKRLYFIEDPVAYCVENEQLNRYRHYSYTVEKLPDASSSAASRVLMAEGITNALTDSNEAPFQVTEATLTRNMVVTLWFRFSQNNEDIVLANEIQVQNVP